MPEVKRDVIPIFVNYACDECSKIPNPDGISINHIQNWETKLCKSNMEMQDKIEKLEKSQFDQSTQIHLNANTIASTENTLLVKLEDHETDCMYLKQEIEKLNDADNANSLCFKLHAERIKNLEKFNQSMIDAQFPAKFKIEMTELEQKIEKLRKLILGNDLGEKNLVNRIKDLQDINDDRAQYQLEIEGIIENLEKHKNFQIDENRKKDQIFDELNKKVYNLWVQSLDTSSKLEIFDKLAGERFKKLESQINNYESNPIKTMKLPSCIHGLIQDCEICDSVSDEIAPNKKKKLWIGVEKKQTNVGGCSGHITTAAFLKEDQARLDCELPLFQIIEIEIDV